MKHRKTSNWGNYPQIEAEYASYETRSELQRLIQNKQDFIIRGNGRSYGDASLNHTILSSLSFNKMLAFDKDNGIFRCQAGVKLSEILEVIVPAGFFLPVTPGTKYITIGGAVAADVHGKNHHKEGSFSDFVHSMEIMTEDGHVQEVTPETTPELFRATCGGMGLTGSIITVTFSLKRISSAYITQTSVKARNLQEMFELFEAGKASTYSMAWLDCFSSGKNLGKGIVSFGEHTPANELPANIKKTLALPSPNHKKVPFYFPSAVLNKFTIKAFNFWYYNKQLKSRKTNIVHFDPFFYPLDSILDWNKIYGKKGFLQYQFVLPQETSYEGITQILKRIQKQNSGSFLTVLKLLGPSNNMLSFPMKGYTLALDFPVTQHIFKLMNELDTIVKDHGGRIYLAKDARMHSDVFEATYPETANFKQLIERQNPHQHFKSLQSKRLNITP